MEKLAHTHRHVLKGGFLILLLAALVATIFGSLYIQQRLTARTDANFQTDSQQITQNIADNIEGYNAVLYSGRALLTSSQTVSQSEWNNFFQSQHTTERVSGISSIFYIDVVPADQLMTFQDTLRADPTFGPTFTVHPLNTTSANYGISTLVYSTTKAESRGFDTFSTPERKDTYLKAEQNNHPTASQPIKLDTGPLGLFITLPVYGSPSKAKGFVGLSLRGEDFASFVVGEKYPNVAIHINDVTDASKPVSMYASENWDSMPDQLASTQKLDVAGRTWEITYKSHRSYDYVRLNTLLPRLVLAIGGLIMLLIILTHIHLQQKAKAHALKIEE